jgi:hypothetical protein
MPVPFPLGEGEKPHFENPKRLNYKHCTPGGAQENQYHQQVCGTDFSL